MSRLPRVLLAAAALAGGVAGTAGLSGCGGRAATVEAGAAPVSSVTPASMAHRDAGWAAPVALPGSTIGRLSEDFRSGAALRRWGYVEGDFGRNRFVVRDGRLVVVPPRSAWVDGHRAFFLFREVRGDFDVRARLCVTGRRGADPDADWSLSGLLVRATPAVAAPENWISLRTGVVGGRRVVERKTTERSRSRLGLLGARDGWTVLRVVRRGARFSLFTRAGHGRWVSRGVYVRPDLPRTLEVGVDAFSGRGGSRADLRSHVDWVRFARA